MSKYKVGDKVVMEITDKISVMEEPWYVLSETTSISETYLDKAAEPLSAYTEPLEAKIRRQVAEITRLLAENKELKEDKAVPNAKIDAYKLYGDQHEEEYNQAFNQGAEAAWELAKKIVLYDKDSYSGEELKEIFGYAYSQTLMKNYTYQEAAAKVAEWEKAKEEVKVGDVLEDIEDRSVKCVATNLYPNNMAYLVFDDGTAGMYKLDIFKKTGRHIDIDGFLKQIGGEQE